MAGVIKTAARKLACADGAAFVFSENELCYYADEDAISALWKGKRFRKEECISGWCMLNKSQVAISDIYLDERIPHEAYRPTFVKSLLMTPVRRNEPLAAIGTYWAHNHEVTSEQQRILQALADVTAIAVQNLEHKGNLEELVKQRTDELTASRDELKQLAYVVSHELQEPLRSMSSNLRLLSARYKDRIGEDADKFIQTALSGGTRAERMLDALWMFARIEKAKTAVGVVSAEDVLRKALSRLSEPIASSNAQITHTELPNVVANAAQLEYVFQELIENAIKFGRNRPSVHISAKKKSKQWFFPLRMTGLGSI